MALSRMAALLLIAPAPAMAEPVSTATEAIERYRGTFKPIAEIDCPTGGAEEIVVCARRQRSQLIELAERAELSARSPGEAPRADAGYGDGRYCFQRCPNIVGVDLQMAIKFVNGIKRLVEGDD